MPISARNQLKATVKNIKLGVVNDVVTLRLESGESFAAVITSESVQTLGLSEGKAVVALFKASDVMLSTEQELLLSARNQLAGKVSQIKQGVVNCEVVVKTAGGCEIVAMITAESASRLALAVGSDVNVIIKASHVILGVAKA